MNRSYDLVRNNKTTLKDQKDINVIRYFLDFKCNPYSNKEVTSINMGYGAGTYMTVHYDLTGYRKKMNINNLSIWF